MQPGLSGLSGLSGLGGHAAQDGMHRLFFALWPDDSLRQRIDETAAQLEREHAPGGRRLRADRYHLTLQFLGDFQPLPPSLVDDACAAAGTVRQAPFDLTLDCAGSFRGSNVWWLGSHAVPPGLQQLWDRLGQSLLQARVRVKSSSQPFAPHLTIQRDVRRHIALLPTSPLRWHVGEFALIDSQPGRPYTVLGRWPLTA
ncbi:MAG TPA: RNA 2',3'-cyclic phosphodiesterase [Lysobacter sp.]